MDGTGVRLRCLSLVRGLLHSVLEGAVTVVVFSGLCLVPRADTLQGSKETIRDTGGRVRKQERDVAMTFEEIGKALGVTRQVVFADYCRAIYKLKRSRMLERLIFVAALRKQMADQRQVIHPEW